MTAVHMESVESAPDPALIALLRSALEQAIGVMTPPDPELKLYTPAQAAELLEVSENWVTERVKARRVPCTFVGRFPRFTAQHIRAIHAEGEVDPSNYGR